MRCARCWPPPRRAFRFTDESLRYNVNWPSGAEPGRSHLHRAPLRRGLGSGCDRESRRPGFALADKFHSAVDRGALLHRIRARPEPRRPSEPTRRPISISSRQAHRAPRCFRPAAARAISESRPAPATRGVPLLRARRVGPGPRARSAAGVFRAGLFGTLDYTGPQAIAWAGSPDVTDRIHVTVKGPKADFVFDIFFARDAARTPLRIRVPLAPGVFSLELVR